MSDQVCVYCGRPEVRAVEGLQGSENAIAIVLLLFMFVPALVYYFVVSGKPFCTACRRRQPTRVGDLRV